MKIGSWLIGIGCCFALAGLCFLPAAFGPHPESTMLNAGAMLLSAGMVLAASGMYMKARSWTQSAPAAPAKADKKGVRKPCKLCSKQDALIFCRAHEMQLCADCLGKHFDFRSCVYIPIERPAASKARARSQSSGA
ncbi:MAG: hypothetical protein WA172_19185 [Terriglobales bacterium]